MVKVKRSQDLIEIPCLLVDNTTHAKISGINRNRRELNKRYSWLGALYLVFASSILLTSCNDPAPAQTPKPVLTSNQQSGCTAGTQPAQTLYVGSGSLSDDPKTINVAALDPASGQKRWQQTVARTTVANFQTLKAADGVLYVSYSLENSDQPVPDAISALDGKDGHQLWQYKAAPQTQINDLQICNGEMIIYNSDTAKNSQAIEAHNLKDGKLLWNYMNNGYIGKPVVTKDTVYTVTATVPDLKQCGTQSTKNTCNTLSTIHALHSSDGKEQWHSNQYTTSFGFVTITATEQAVYAIYPTANEQSMKDQQNVQINNTVDALFGTNGQQVWHTQTMVTNTVNQSAVLDGQLYLNGNGLVALQVTDGKALWFRDGQGGTNIQVNSNGLSSFTQSAGNFCTLNLQTGKDRWCSTVPTSGTSTTSSTDTIYTAASFANIVHALQKENGTQRWQYAATKDQHIFALALA